MAKQGKRSKTSLAQHCARQQLKSLMEKLEMEVPVEQANAQEKSSVPRALQTILMIQNLKPPKNSSGQIKCPWCPEGHIKYSVAFNGHIHAACTHRCVAFMQ